MMGLTPTEQNAIVDYSASRLTYASAHTGDPSTTGANEASGGGYAREALSFGAAASQIAEATLVEITVPAGTYTHIGFNSAAIAGTFRGSDVVRDSNGDPISGGVVMSAPGTLRVTARALWA
jgi:hypothetical protein